jgi:hypothetical protein
MLVAIKDNGTLEPITHQPHEKEFRQWRRNLTPDDFQNVCTALNQYVDTEGKGEIATSSWIPGADWIGTPYEPIYHAVGDSWEMARYFFGMIVWHVFLNRPETFSFGRYPRNPGEIIGWTYFKVEVPSLR